MSKVSYSQLSQLRRNAVALGSHVPRTPGASNFIHLLCRVQALRYKYFHASTQKSLIG